MSAEFSETFDRHEGKYTDKWSSYLDIYSHLLDPVRDTVTSVLEIGVMNGGSLEVWGEYFPNAQTIIGCDIDENCRKLSFDDPRISVVVGDANAPATMKRVLATRRSFDIIVDDGSHVSSDIIATFCRYFPHVTPGGYLIIEDLSTSYWQRYQGGLAYPESSMQFLKLLADVVNHEHWGFPAARHDLLTGFSASSGLLSDETLADVYSVMFFNSVCIVRKASPELQPNMGIRVGAGTEAIVMPSGPTMKGTTLQSDESGNPFAIARGATDITAPRDRDDLLRRVAELTRINNELRSSTSWKITRPLRAIKSFLSRSPG